MGTSGSAIDLDGLARILPRYDGPGPRYTSYPTAPVWADDVGAGFLERELATLDASEPVSLYAHVPFCRSLCHFCACNRVITRDAALPDRYLDTIAREVAATRERLGAGSACEMHWGGGTPTHLAPGQIRRLHGILTDAFPLGPDAEVSIEVDPRVTSEEQVETLRDCGFGRISLGVQDTDPRVQEAIHRIQPLEQTATLVAHAREVGFASVGFDLIYGLPFQTRASFERTLDGVLDLGPDRVALYGYAHVTWKAKQQRGFERHDLPDAETRLQIFLDATRRFLDAGYVPIGMDHFARPEDGLARALHDGTLRRNFMGYTTRAGSALLGFGPSAISELPSAYAQAERELGGWGAAVEARGLATARGHHLSDDDLVRRWVIGRIMCRFAVDPGEFRARFGEDFGTRFARELGELRPLEQDGLLDLDAAGGLRVTPLGRLFLRCVAMAFDAYLPAQLEGQRPVFSRVV